MKTIIKPMILLLLAASGVSFAIPGAGFAAAGASVASAEGPSGAGPAAGGDRILALVGDDTVRIADLDAEFAATLAAAKGRPGSAPIDPAGVLKRLIQDRLLEQEGFRMGADSLAAVRSQVNDRVRTLSVKALMDSVSAPPPGSASAADSLLGRVLVTKRYSHILVKEEAQARTLRDSLDHGVPFADLARRHSLDQTGKAGGDLGWNAPGSFVKEFEQAADALELHGIAGPVRTEFGWHLITLTGVRSDTLKSKEMAQAMAQARDRQRRTKAVYEFVLSLKRKYHVAVDDSLRSTLDYASSDPQVDKSLETSEAPLAVFPWGRLTVRGLTQNLRFQYFHGLAGRTDAAALRDRAFDDWLAEALLSHEARVRGFDRSPGILQAGRLEERYRLREQVLKTIVNEDYEPTESEITAHYRTHLQDFTPAPRLKVRSVLVEHEAFARVLLERMSQGAELKWLASQYPDSVSDTPPFPTDWVDPKELPAGGQALKEGSAVGPLKTQDGWAVAEVAAVETVAPTPLDQCRGQVIAAMRNLRALAAIKDGLARLESATRITVADGAKDAIAARLAELQAAAPKGGTP